MTRLYVDGPTVIRAVAAAVANLEAHVEEVDALNVFPVPDGDTGSNMLATMRAALAEAERLPAEQRDLDSVAEALSRGALTGARGNSGVILSQIIRGMTQRADGRRRANGLDLAQGLRRGSEVAYGAVLTPVEGTILTVIRDAAEAAEAAAGRQPHVEAVLADVIAAAASSVQRTPMLLPVLEDAGVVDSGGQGLYRILEGTLQVQARGRVPDGAASPRPRSDRGARPAILAPSRAAPRSTASTGTCDHGDAHGYETEYLLASPEGAHRHRRAATGHHGRRRLGRRRRRRAPRPGPRPRRAARPGHRRRPALRAPLRGGRPRPRRPGRSPRGARAAGGPPSVPAASRRAAPRPWRRPPGRRPAHEAPAARRRRSLVAVAEAAGLARALESLGARVVRPSHGTRPSVGEIAEAILAVGSSEVIVLPNDRDALLAARHAAELTPMVTVGSSPRATPPRASPPPWPSTRGPRWPTTPRA